MKAGEQLDRIGGYTNYGQCENYDVVCEKNLIPQGLAEGCVLKRDVARDEPISYNDVEPPGDSVATQLRAEQNELFPV